VIPRVGRRRRAEQLGRERMPVEGEAHPRERPRDPHGEATDARSRSVCRAQGVGSQVGRCSLIAGDPTEHLGPLDEPPHLKEGHAEVVGDHWRRTEPIGPLEVLDGAGPTRPARRTRPPSAKIARAAADARAASSWALTGATGSHDVRMSAESTIPRESPARTQAARTQAARTQAARTQAARTQAVWTNATGPRATRSCLI
jgi:hypothetical protein